FQVQLLQHLPCGDAYPSRSAYGARRLAQHVCGRQRAGESCHYQNQVAFRGGEAIAGNRLDCEVLREARVRSELHPSNWQEAAQARRSHAEYARLRPWLVSLLCLRAYAGSPIAIQVIVLEPELTAAWNEEASTAVTETGITESDPFTVA